MIQPIVNLSACFEGATLAMDQFRQALAELGTLGILGNTTVTVSPAFERTIASCYVRRKGKLAERNLRRRRPRLRGGVR